MSTRTATFYRADGEPILSYRADSGRVLSTTTVPMKVYADLATALGYEGMPTGGSSDFGTTRQIDLHVYEVASEMTLTVGVRIGKNHTSYLEADGAIWIPLRWVGTSDFRDVYADE